MTTISFKNQKHTIMNNEKKVTKGYKVTDADGKCRGHQFEVGNTYKHNGKVVICESGFHFCLKASHCFNYYDFTPTNRVFEVEGIGEISQKEDGDSKVAVGEITILRELKWEEVLVIANDGTNNTGHSNTGNWNTGYSNTGDRNTGYRNTGNRNTGNWNTGDRNTGDRNTGDRNTGDRNTGDRNTGYWNTGDRNTGYWNTGDRNTGNWNTGYRNTGYSNTGDRNTGLFCIKDAPFPIFDKPSKWTEKDFLESKVYYLMCNYVNTKLWVSASQMTDQEKEQNPSYKTAEGFLRDIPFKEAFQNAWNNFDEASKQAFIDLPNFNAKSFFHITGVKVK